MSDDPHVALVLYGDLGDWDEAEIVHPGCETEWADAKAEYSKMVVVPLDQAFDMADRYEVEEVTEVK